jgi:FkbM family methyltransferase
VSRTSRSIAGYIGATRTLLSAGVTLRSILLYPIRRRSVSPRNQIDLNNGISITAPVNEPLLPLFKEVWSGHCYTPAHFDIGAGDTVVDIGANVGVFTLWAASRHPDVKVIAVEPSPLMCEFLRRNIVSSGLHTVTVVQSAVGGQTGQAILYSRGAEVLNSLYSQDVLGSEFHPLIHTPVLTLEAVFDRYGLQTCHLLKMDCEGAEYEVLLNARQDTLDRIHRISMEYHIGLNKHEPEDLVFFLENRGFQVEKTPMIDEEGGYLYAQRKLA